MIDRKWFKKNIKSFYTSNLYFQQANNCFKWFKLILFILINSFYCNEYWSLFKESNMIILNKLAFSNQPVLWNIIWILMMKLNQIHNNFWEDNIKYWRIDVDYICLRLLPKNVLLALSTLLLSIWWYNHIFANFEKISKV